MQVLPREIVNKIWVRLAPPEFLALICTCREYWWTTPEAGERYWKKHTLLPIYRACSIISTAPHYYFMQLARKLLTKFDKHSYILFYDLTMSFYGYKQNNWFQRIHLLISSHMLTRDVLAQIKPEGDRVIYNIGQYGLINISTLQYWDINDLQTAYNLYPDLPANSGKVSLFSLI
jgi:hypothetical protein